MTSDERLIRGYTGLMLLLLSVGLVAAKIPRWVLPPLLPSIIDDMLISPFQAGIILSVASLSFALFQFPSGRLSDQLTRKTVLIGSLLVIIIGSLLLSVTDTYRLLLVGAAVIGLGGGLYGVAGRGLLSDLFVKNRGVAFGIHGTFSDMGGILAAGLATAALALGSWQNAFLPILGGGIVITYLIGRKGRESLVLKPVSFEMRGTAVRLFGQRRFQFLLVAYSLFAFTSQGVIGFLPALLQTDHGFSLGLASASFAGLFATGIVVRPLAGRFSDGRDRLKIAGSGLIVGVLGLIILVTASSHLFAITGVVIFAAGQKSFPPVMQAHLMDAFPEKTKAGDLGATRTVYLGIGSLGPAFVGYIGGQLSYTAAFTGFIAALLIGGIIVLSLRFIVFD